MSRSHSLRPRRASLVTALQSEDILMEPTIPAGKFSTLLAIHK